MLTKLSNYTMFFLSKYLVHIFLNLFNSNSGIFPFLVYILDLYIFYKFI